MRFNPITLLVIAVLSLLVFAGCSLSPRINAPAGTPFRPPTLLPPTPQPTATLAQTKTGDTKETPGATCSDSLAFVSDLTIEDGTIVEPGSTLDKRWLVRNTGSCNWEEGYTLRLVAGEEFGAVAEQSLVPARSGSDATIRIVFTAPDEEGDYRSAWAAYNPDGMSFGDPIYIVFIVQVPAEE